MYISKKNKKIFSPHTRELTSTAHASSQTSASDSESVGADARVREDLTREIVKDPPQVLDAPHAADAETSYAQFLKSNTGEGVLRVWVSAGEGSIPLVNVNVEVYKDFPEGRHVFYTDVTNADGIAGDMLLPAPPRENSLSEGRREPFADYSVRAYREGLEELVVENVPVFSSVRSVQPITMRAAEG